MGTSKNLPNKRNMDNRKIKKKTKEKEGKLSLLQRWKLKAEIKTIRIMAKGLKKKLKKKGEKQYREDLEKAILYLTENYETECKIEGKYIKITRKNINKITTEELEKILDRGFVEMEKEI